MIRKPPRKPVINHDYLYEGTPKRENQEETYQYSCDGEAVHSSSKPEHGSNWSKEGSCEQMANPIAGSIPVCMAHILDTLPNRAVHSKAIACGMSWAAYSPIRRLQTSKYVVLPTNHTYLTCGGEQCAALIFRTTRRLASLPPTCSRTNYAVA